MDDIPSRPVHVVAAVIRDMRGRILLTRRTEGRDLAGRWEFPGGKVEAGESPLQALDRELHEELGIRLLDAEPLIAVPARYPNKDIVLDVYTAHRIEGNIKAMERQALAWSPLEKLLTYPMPPADRPVVAALQLPDRYMVTSEPGNDDDTFIYMIEQALGAGVRMIQLRSRQAGVERLRRLITRLLPLCAVNKAQLLINSHIEIANEFRIGLQLRADQLAVLTQRPVSSQQLLGASCHHLPDLQKAQSLGADFAVLGPLAATSSHPDAEPLGWARFAQWRAEVSLPIYAIGGMHPNLIDTARRHGSQGIAAITAFQMS